MARNKVRGYLDVPQTWPDKTVEELEKMIEEADEESKKLTEWPKA